MKPKRSVLLILLGLFLVACDAQMDSQNASQNNTLKQEAVDAVMSALNTGERFNQVVGDIPFKSTLITEATNFDNLQKRKVFSIEEANLLHLNEIYPQFKKEGHLYQFIPSYQLLISNNFYTVVFHIMKGEHELETVLINYGLKGNLIAHQVIAYDDIAEGLFRKYATIDKRMVKVFEEHYDKHIKTSNVQFYIDQLGKIKPIKMKDSSSSKKSTIDEPLAAASNTSHSFVISCGSGCAMTYSENKLIRNDMSNEVTFKVEMYQNEVLNDEYFETYVITCNHAKKVSAIKIKGTKDGEIDNQPVAMIGSLRAYSNQFCHFF